MPVTIKNVKSKRQNRYFIRNAVIIIFLLLRLPDICYIWNIYAQIVWHSPTGGSNGKKYLLRTTRSMVPLKNT